MKKIIYLTLIFILSSVMTVFSEMPVTVKINNNTVEFDVPPQIISGRTMVPMRKIYEELGAEVEWIAEAELIIVTYKSSIITAEIGGELMSVTDVITGETKEFILDVTPQLIDNRTLVPVRAVSEVLGKDVDWNENTWTVLITDV